MLSVSVAHFASSRGCLLYASCCVSVFCFLMMTRYYEYYNINVSICIFDGQCHSFLTLCNKRPKWFGKGCIRCTSPSQIGFLSLWDPYAVISLQAVAYSSYCNMVEWFWWDWSLSQWPTGFLQCFDAVSWVIWPVETVPKITYNVSGGTWTLHLYSLTYPPLTVGESEPYRTQRWVPKSLHFKQDLDPISRFSTPKPHEVAWQTETGTSAAIVCNSYIRRSLIINRADWVRINYFALSDCKNVHTHGLVQSWFVVFWGSSNVTMSVRATKVLLKLQFPRLQDAYRTCISDIHEAIHKPVSNPKGYGQSSSNSDIKWIFCLHCCKAVQTEQ